MFPITVHVQLLYFYIVIVSYLPSDIQRSPTYYYRYITYYYRYIALLSFRGACFMALSFVFLRYFSMLHWIGCFFGTAYLAGSPSYSHISCT